MKIRYDTHNETNQGTTGWLILTGFVLAWDLTQEESLSHAVYRGLEHGRLKPLLYGAIGATALHLANAIPDRVDPYCYLLRNRV